MTTQEPYEPAFIAETLEWCNSIREQKGMKPLERLPRGVVGDPQSCPCGKATGTHVNSSTYFFDVNDPEDDRRFLPAPVKQFICDFDAELLPQYVEQGGGPLE